MEFWGLDPSYFGHRKILIEFIHRIHTRQKDGHLEYYYHDRPVSRVEVVGVVVNILRRKNSIILTIDDGTGLLACFKYISAHMVETSDPLKFADIGSVVTVQGTLQSVETNEIEYGLTIKVTSIFTSPDPNIEAYHWTSCMLLDREEYSRAAVAPITGGGAPQEEAPPCTCHGLAGDDCVEVALPNLSLTNNKNKNKKSTEGANDANSGKDTGTGGGEYVRPGRHVKEELLYCPCVSSKTPRDPGGAFQVNLLFYILSRLRGNAANGGDVSLSFVLNEGTLLGDAAVRAMAASHLTRHLARNVYGTATHIFGLGTQTSNGNDSSVNDTIVVPVEDEEVSILIEETLDSYLRDGFMAPLTGQQQVNTQQGGTWGTSSYQLITKDFLVTALQSCIVALIQEKRRVLCGDEMSTHAAKVTREQFEGELRDDPQLAPDAVDELDKKAPFIPKWRINYIMRHCYLFL